MNSELFVQNVKNACTIKGVAPTVACRESGAGTSFINNIESRGQIPSVAKVQLLAAYLGVTTSELLGEILPEVKEQGTQMDALPSEDARLMELLRLMSPIEKKSLIEKIEFLISMRE